MLNKIDKCFLITAVIMLILITLSFVTFVIFANFEFNVSIEIFFGFIVILTIFILPISIIIQIITFVIKIFDKNKNKKDWTIILINFAAIFIFSIILFMLYAATTNPLL